MATFFATLRMTSLLVAFCFLCMRPHLVSCFSASKSNLFRRPTLTIQSPNWDSQNVRPWKAVGRKPSSLFGKNPKEDVANGSATTKKRVRKRSLPKLAVRIYMNYFSQLWTDTNTDARKRIAKDKAAAAIRRVQHLVEGEEYVDLSLDGEAEIARKKLLDASQDLLHAMHWDEEEESENDPGLSGKTPVTNEAKDVDPAKKKGGRSVLFGAVMGAAVACWVFSGDYIFTGIFTLMTILGQLEYYRMVMNTGIYPARRISVLGACSMFLTVSLIC